MWTDKLEGKHAKITRVIESPEGDVESLVIEFDDGSVFRASVEGGRNSEARHEIVVGGDMDAEAFNECWQQLEPRAVKVWGGLIGLVYALADIKKLDTDM